MRNNNRERRSCLQHSGSTRLRPSPPYRGFGGGQSSAGRCRDAHPASVAGLEPASRTNGACSATYPHNEEKWSSSFGVRARSAAIVDSLHLRAESCLIPTLRAGVVVCRYSDVADFSGKISSGNVHAASQQKTCKSPRLCESLLMCVCVCLCACSCVNQGSFQKADPCLLIRQFRRTQEQAARMFDVQIAISGGGQIEEGEPESLIQRLLNRSC